MTRMGIHVQKKSSMLHVLLYIYIINMIYYFVHENIFAVDKDNDNITSSVQIGCLQVFNM